MKKFLLLAVLATASLSQAAGQSCGEYVKCHGSVREGQTFKCPDCVCPEVKCPVLPETKCDCIAKVTPVQESYCAEKKSCKPCGHCHACKAGRHHMCHTCKVEAAPAVSEERATEKKQMRTPKRVKSPKAAAVK